MKNFIYFLFLSFYSFWIQDVKSQTSAADNRIAESITFSEPPKSPDIYGIFEGRTPCVEISKQLGADLPRDCEKLKWQVILFVDSLSRQPTSYALRTELFNRTPLKGKWSIIKGIPTDPAAIVYALEYGKRARLLYILEGDENVLFILDENREFRTGNKHYSYTLNRVKKVRRLSK